MVEEAVLIYSLLSVILVSLMSFIGVLTLSLNIKKLKNVLLFLVSLAAGSMLGDAFIHLLPEAVEESGFGIGISLSILFGILVFFIIEKFIHWNHCHMPTSRKHVHSAGIMNLVGDGLHNFIDGLIIASSYLVSIPVGIATTIAVILHEIPQEIGDFGILIHSGFKVPKALLYNFLTAITAVLGAIISLYLGNLVGSFNLFLIPFTVGGFIYIAASDLIPELHKEVKISKSIMQLFGLVLGIAFMIGLIFLE